MLKFKERYFFNPITAVILCFIINFTSFYFAIYYMNEYIFIGFSIITIIGYYLMYLRASHKYFYINEAKQIKTKEEKCSTK